MAGTPGERVTDVAPTIAVKQSRADRLLRGAGEQRDYGFGEIGVGCEFGLFGAPTTSGPGRRRRGTVPARRRSSVAARWSARRRGRPRLLSRWSTCTCRCCPARGQLFFEGPERNRRLSRYWLLLPLPAVIAAAGVVGDSTATVVGAMIVALLMTPILGIVLAVVLGRHSVRTGLRRWVVPEAFAGFQRDVGPLGMSGRPWKPG